MIFCLGGVAFRKGEDLSRGELVRCCLRVWHGEDGRGNTRSSWQGVQGPKMRGNTHTQQHEGKLSKQQTKEARYHSYTPPSLS